MAAIVQQPSVCDKSRIECLICYKSFSKSLERNESSEKLERFFVALERFVGLPQNSNITRLLTPDLEVCLECTSFVESFSEEHHQWKLLELRLEWRIELLLKMLSKIKPRENDPMIQLRSEISKQCLHRQQISQPRVTLYRAQTSERCNTSKAQSRPLSSLLDGNDIQLEFDQIADISISQEPPSVTLNCGHLFEENVKIENNISQESSLLAPEDLPEQPNLANIANPYNFTNKCDKFLQNAAEEEDDDYSSETSSDSELEDYSIAQVIAIAVESAFETNYNAATPNFEVGSLSSLRSGFNDLCTSKKSEGIQVVSSLKTGNSVNPLDAALPKNNESTEADFKEDKSTEISRDPTPECQDMENESAYLAEKSENASDNCHSVTFSDSEVQDHSNAKLTQYKTFTCKICYKSFWSKGFLQRHTKDHHNNISGSKKLGGYRCHPCKRLYATYAKYTAHVKKIHKGRWSKSYFRKRQKCVANLSNPVNSAESKPPQQSNSCSEPPQTSKFVSSSKPTDSEVKVENRYSLRTKRNAIYVEESDSDAPSVQDPAYDMQVESDSSSNDDEPSQISVKNKNIVDKMNPSQSERCDEPGCTAYFRKRRQKSNHMQNVHNVKQKHLEENLPVSTTSKSGKTEKKFVCNHCQKTFLKPGGLLRHKRLYHRQNANADKPFQCIYKKGKRLFVCPVVKCTSHFDSQEQLENHKKLHGSFKCQFCTVTVSFAPDLAVHEMEHVPERVNAQDKKIYPCPRCKYTSPLKHILSRHFCAEHLNLHEGALRCPICQTPVKELKNQSVDKNLISHLQMSHGVKNAGETPPDGVLKCDLCPAFFKVPKYLYVHKIKDHWKRRCPVCPDFKPTGIDRAKQLKKHLEKLHPELVSENLPFACSVGKCTARYFTQELLDNHIRIHADNEVECQCTKCGKAFPSMQKLKLHDYYYHTEEGSLICPECGKTYALRASLNLHIKYTHKPVEDLKYKCDKCNRRFVDRQKLDQHQWTHTKEKQFVCQFCGEKYAYRHTWKRHVQIKHPEEFEKIGRERTRTKTAQN